MQQKYYIERKTRQDGKTQNKKRIVHFVDCGNHAWYDWWIMRIG